MLYKSCLPRQGLPFATARCKRRQHDKVPPQLQPQSFVLDSTGIRSGHLLEVAYVDQLTSMRVYCAVAELESFTRAADKLEMAKSMVTKHVSALEDRLGVRLLNRTTRKLSRTEAGQAYYERCRELLADIDALNTSVGEFIEQPRGTLRITAPVSFGVQYLGGAIASFMDNHPDVRVDLEMSDRVIDLIDEGCDVAVRIARLVNSSLVARQISKTRIVVCASASYLNAHGMPQVPADLARHKCLAYAYASGGDDWKAEGPSGQVSVKVPWVMRANNGDILRSAALQGAGIILQPTFLVGQDLRDGRLVEVLTDYQFGTLGIHAVYPHRRHLSAKVRAFVQHLGHVLPEQI